MRFRSFALAALTLMLSSGASALTINADYDVDSTGGLSAKITGAPGDTLVINLHVNPKNGESVSGWNFLFSYSDDVSLGSLVGVSGTQQSIDNPGRRFSYNNALSDDLFGRALTATITVLFGPNADLNDYLRIDAGSAVTLGLNENFEDRATGPGDIASPIPEPGTALLFGAGAMGLALVRRRSA